MPRYEHRACQKSLTPELSVGPSPIEFHSMVEHAEIIWQNNIWEMLFNRIGTFFDSDNLENNCE